MTFKQKYGQYALITGGTSGIGREMANKLSSLGLDLILVARKDIELNKTKEELQSKFSNNVVCVSADLTLNEGIEKIINVINNYDVGLFVANAGIEVNGAFEKNNIENEISVVQVNIIALLKLTHFVVQKFIPKKKGGLLFVSSLSGHMPNPYFANYAGTKSFVLNFGASLYGELKPKGIDVTVLSPGLTNTPMVADNGVNWSKTPMSALSPVEVAEIGVSALGNRFLAIPGFKNRIMAFMAKHLPLQLQANMNQKMMLKAINSNKI